MENLYKKSFYLLSLKLLLFLVVVATSINIVNAQNQILDGDTNVLQVSKHELDSIIDARTKDLFTKRDSLIEENVEIAKNYTESADKLVDRISGLIPAIIGGGVVALLSVFLWAQRKARIEFIQTLENQLRKNKNTLNNIFAKHDLDIQILEQSKILVLKNVKSLENKNFEAGLEIFKNKVEIELESFHNAKDVINEKLKSNSLTVTDYDAIIVKNDGSIGKEDFAGNSTDMGWENTEFADFVNSTKLDTVILYYGIKLDRKGLRPDQMQYISFANVPSQLFGNLLNLLKYRNELRKLSQETI